MVCRRTRTRRCSNIPRRLRDLILLRWLRGLTLPNWFHNSLLFVWATNFINIVGHHALVTWRSSPTILFLAFAPIGIEAGWQRWKSEWIAFLNGICLVPVVDLHVIAAEEFAAQFGKTFGRLFFLDCREQREADSSRHRIAPGRSDNSEIIRPRHHHRQLAPDPWPCFSLWILCKSA
ncbi:hypothetical protein B0H66DRAFT_569575 [Apodospora peruviana]|uniref:Uncharacterized protein n=1 Tax=Apodospora peruviana TaxID=516989 RepID=A0AAE0LYZ3_9PEZI|nr:hypothetical protein B0H66DRAFT_569575 [Apodospora peruviana]